MKRIFLAISIVLLLSFIYLAVVNMNNNFNLNYIHSVLDTQNFKTFNLGVYTLVSVISGIFVGAGVVYMFLSAQNDKVKAYQRELEKTSVSGMNNASRVEVLEAKIKTLEKAFNTVADERTQLEVQIKNLNQEIDNITKNK